MCDRRVFTRLGASLGVSWFVLCLGSFSSRGQGPASRGAVDPQAAVEQILPDAVGGLSLLGLPAVQRELKLTPEQNEDVDAILAALPAFRGEYRRPAKLHSAQTRSEPAKKRRTFADPVHASHWAWHEGQKLALADALSVLTPEQSQRLRQLWLQWDISKVLQHTPVQEELEFTTQQQREFDELGNQQRAREAELADADLKGVVRRGAHYETARNEFGPRHLALLTDTQRQKLREMQGTIFEFTDADRSGAFASRAAFDRTGRNSGPLLAAVDLVEKLQLPSIERELKLTDEQKARIAAIGSQMPDRLNARQLTPKAKDKVQELGEEARSLLTAEQQQRFRGIGLWLRGTEALHELSMADELGFSAAQRQELRWIERDQRNESRQSSLIRRGGTRDPEQSVAEARRRQEEFDAKRLALLTDEQRAHLDQLKGPRFELDEAERNRTRGLFPIFAPGSQQ